MKEPVPIEGFATLNDLAKMIKGRSAKLELEADERNVKLKIHWSLCGTEAEFVGRAMASKGGPLSRTMKLEGDLNDMVRFLGAWVAGDLPVAFSFSKEDKKKGEVDDT